MEVTVKPQLEKLIEFLNLLKTIMTEIMSNIIYYLKYLKTIV